MSAKQTATFKMAVSHIDCFVISLALKSCVTYYRRGPWRTGDCGDVGGVRKRLHYNEAVLALNLQHNNRISLEEAFCLVLFPHQGTASLTVFTDRAAD
jgi:hypothetical protein